MRAMPVLFLLLLTLLTSVLAACQPARPAALPQPTTLPQPAVQTQAITPTATPYPTAQAPEPTQGQQLSFSAATYQDESAGFELDYPSGWTLQPRSTIGERGSQALLLSPGTTPETLAEGGSRIAMIVYKWDPKKDLAAYLKQRETAWVDSDSTILTKTSWELADGRQAVNLVVQGPDQGQAFFLLTTAGEDYLQIGGEGDLALIAEIARTLRPLEVKP
jgi:hypothetical protein